LTGDHIKIFSCVTNDNPLPVFFHGTNQSRVSKNCFYFCKNYFVKIYSFKSTFIIGSLVCIWLTGCSRIDVFEKNIAIPRQQWHYSLKPGFDFTISDTSSLYNLYIVLRHTDAYRYNNIWLNIGTQSPADTMQYQQFELQLGTDARGWEGAGMDDIWELRKSITRGPVKFYKKGNYTFSVAQMMRENPLPEIISVGVRVEKVK
jgi:gliding motility-associated lipoprotein GldH